MTTSEIAVTTLVPKNRQRKAVVPPTRLHKNMSLFDYLSRCTPPLTKKIADIACAQTAVPAELRKDAVQEVYLMWSGMKPDTYKFRPGQIAAYAHAMARHAALHLRRKIGSVTTLPGSAFRKRKDGSSYVTPGLLAAPVDWNEMESWFQADRREPGMAADGILSTLNEEMLLDNSGESLSEDESSELTTMTRRMEDLESARDELSVRQYEIAVALVRGADLEEMTAQFEVKKAVLMRELSVVAGVLGSFSSQD